MNFESFKSLYLKQAPQEFPNKVKTNPILSVIVLTYQHADYIEECLDGILKQETDFEFEIIIGEDDSKDGTRETCMYFAKKYPEKIRLILHTSINKIKVNEEITGNFNAVYCFFQTRGKYISFCEGDDYWEDPKKLQKQLNFLQRNSEFILSFHNYKKKYLHTNKIIKNKANKYKQPSKNIPKIELLLSKEHPLLVTVCFRKAFQEIPSQLLEVLNLDTFLLSFLGNFGKAKYQGEIKPAISRKHPTGIWNSQTRINQLYLKLLTLKKLEEFYSTVNSSISTYYKKKRRNQNKMIIWASIKSINKPMFRKSIMAYFR